MNNQGFSFITILSSIIFMSMATTFGIDFPFRNSMRGDYLRMTETPEAEVRANLIHLILTRKGTRYYLPDFGTRLYEFIFEPNDAVTFQQIEDEIRDSVKKYIPKLDIKSITIVPAENDGTPERSISEDEDERLFRVSDTASKPYTAVVRLDYDINTGTFTSSDFIIINI